MSEVSSGETQVELEPEFAAYLVDEPSLSYVQPTDGLARRTIIDLMERMLGRAKLESAYHELKSLPFDINSFFTNAIAKTQIRVNYLGLNPQDIDVDGPLIFVANHPFGILDGMILCDLAVRVRSDFRILINSALCQDKDFAPYFLPVDFEPTKKATKTNIRTKQLALKQLAEGVPVLIFPSGMVSTANSLGFGAVKDAPWTTFAAKMIRESKATVVPVYFHGQNSRVFHIASHIGEPLRMGTLMYEAVRKFGETIDVVIGEPLVWDELSMHVGRQDLTNMLYKTVQQLGMGSE